MAVNDTATWVIAYDIRSPRRLQRVHRFLSQEALHIQYSVFLARGTLQRIGVLRSALEDLIDLKADDVRIYRVPESPSIHTVGAQGLPEGVLMLDGSATQGKVPFTARSPLDKRISVVDMEET